MSSRRKQCSWRKTSSELLEEAEAKMFEGLKKTVEPSFVNITGDNVIRTIKVPSSDQNDRLPLVLLHGFAGGLGFWTLNLDALSEKQDVYAIDLLGFGRSSRPKFPTDHEEAEQIFVKSIEDWRQQVGLDKFILLGHSFGGFIAAAYAMVHPGRVHHLILADPWGFPVVPAPGEEPVQIPGYLKTLASIILSFNPLAVLRAAGPLGPSIVRRARSDLRLKFERIYGEDDYRIMEYIYHCNAQKPSGESAFMTMADLKPFPYSKSPMKTRVSQFDPNLSITILYGSNSWMEMFSDFNSIHDLHDDIDIQEIPGAGHHVYADKADLFNQVVNDTCSIDEFERHFRVSRSREIRSRSNQTSNSEETSTSSLLQDFLGKTKLEQ